MRHLSPLKQKILLTLLTGVALGFTSSPTRQKRIFKVFLKSWKEINQKKLSAAVSDLHRSRFLQQKKHSNGVYSFVLTAKGTGKAISYQFEHLKLKKRRWDGRWRFVSFDIPEEFRRSRNILREKLRALGFKEFQKSIFVVPLECREEIQFIVMYLNLMPFVRYGIIQSVDNEDVLKRTFNLS